MFETEIDEGGSFLSFALQQVGVCIASVIWALITSEIPRGLSSASGGNVIEAVCIVTLSFVPAALFGSGVQRSVPRLASSGRRIWLLPCFLLLVGLLSALHNTMFVSDVSDLFYPSTQGEAWWAVYLFTYPTLGCLGYSVGIIFRARYQEKQRQRKTEVGT